MTDPRDALFSRIHREHLKQRGFLKQQRRSVKDAGDGRLLTVLLEKYPAIPGGPYRFSIDLKVTWREPGHRSIACQVSLPGFVNGAQFWSLDEADGVPHIIEQANELFLRVGMAALEDMRSLEGIARIFDQTPSNVGLIWYWNSYVEVLVRLGRISAAKALLHRVIAELETREDVQRQAMEMLASIDPAPEGSPSAPAG